MTLRLFVLELPKQTLVHDYGLNQNYLFRQLPHLNENIHMNTC